MIFHNVLEKALGSPIKLKILKYLFSEGVPTSERELARILNASHMTINRAMKDFEQLNLVTKTRLGGAAVWKLKTDSFLYRQIHGIVIFNTPLEELKGMLKTTLIYCNTYGIVRIKETFIYGSIAEGKEHMNSDIDLFIVVDQKKEYVLKKLGEIEDKILISFGNRLSTYILSEKEYYNPNKQQKIIIEKAEKGMRLI